MIYMQLQAFIRPTLELIYWFNFQSQSRIIGLKHHYLIITNFYVKFLSITTLFYFISYKTTFYTKFITLYT